MPNGFELAKFSPPIAETTPPVRIRATEINALLPVNRVVNIPINANIPPAAPPLAFPSPSSLPPQNLPALSFISPQSPHPLRTLTCASPLAMAPPALTMAQLPDAIRSGWRGVMDNVTSRLDIRQIAAEYKNQRICMAGDETSMTTRAHQRSEITPCRDESERSQALRALHGHLAGETANDWGEKGIALLDDLIEFPDMLDGADLMLKVADNHSVVSLLAASQRHLRYDLPVIELFIGQQNKPQDNLRLLRTALGQLRQEEHLPVWIQLDGTNLPETQLRRYGFKNAHDENYMELAQPVIDPLPPRPEAAGGDALTPSPDSIPQALDRARRYLADQIQPDMDIYRSDMALLPQLIEHFNRQKPGLNLSYLAHIEQITPALEKMAADSCERFIMHSILSAETAGTLHHLMLDVYKNSEENLSVIFMDSFAVDHPGLGHRDITQYLLRTHPQTRLCFIGTGVQKSPYDCIQYSLQCASTCYREQHLLHELHQSMLSANNVTGRSGQQYLADNHVVLIPPRLAGDVLSAEFFKHMSSRQAMSDLLTRYPELAEATVGKAREALAARQQRGLATHTALLNGEEKKVTYNISIEQKRLKNFGKLFNA